MIHPTLDANNVMVDAQIASHHSKPTLIAKSCEYIAQDEMQDIGKMARLRLEFELTVDKKIVSLLELPQRPQKDPLPTSRNNIPNSFLSQSIGALALYGNKLVGFYDVTMKGATSFTLSEETILERNEIANRRIIEISSCDSKTYMVTCEASLRIQETLKAALQSYNSVILNEHRTRLPLLILTMLANQKHRSFGEDSLKFTQYEAICEKYKSQKGSLCNEDLTAISLLNHHLINDLKLHLLQNSKFNTEHFHPDYAKLVYSFIDALPRTTAFMSNPTDNDVEAITNRWLFSTQS